MFQEATDLIESRLMDNWTTTPIDWDNVEYAPKRGTAFTRLQVQWTSTNSTSIGGRDVGEGYINLSIFVPSNTGTSMVNGLANDLSELFNKWDTGQLKFGVARTMRIGEQEQWYRLDVIVPFKYEVCDNQ